MNCNGVRGEPLVDGEDPIDLGLWPLGVRREKEGTKGSLGSGVRGGAGGGDFDFTVVVFVLVISAASSSVAELIHFSS